ncbi:hypothetical protein LINPERPRIM_LOCUS18025 [Linum perenne]
MVLLFGSGISHGYEMMRTGSLSPSGLVGLKISGFVNYLSQEKGSGSRIWLKVCSRRGMRMRSCPLPFALLSNLINESGALAKMGSTRSVQDTEWSRTG